jgi:hypothetical protein
MTDTGTTTASSPATRRVGHAFAVAGHAFAVAVNAALLVAVNVWPGWRVLPFLTEDFVQVLPLVNLGFAAGIAVNLVYLAVDRRVVRASGDIVTTAIGLAAMIRLVQVFPFAFPGPGFDWALVVRALLVLGIAGTSIALLVAAVSVVRLVAGFLPGRRVG